MSKRQFDLEIDEEEIKRLRRHDQCYQIIKAIENVHQALKPRYVRLDELVHNRGLQHLARHIFHYLDFKSLAQCRIVSKGWKDFIDRDSNNFNFKTWKLLLSFLSKFKTVPIPLVGHPEYWEEEWDESFTLQEQYLEFTDMFDFIGEHMDFTTLTTFTLFLIEYDKSMQTFANYCDSPLHYAAIKRRFDVFEIMIKTPFKNLNVENYHGQNLLHESLLGLACERGDFEVVKYFMDLQGQGCQKIDFKERGYRGCTLFHQACISSHPDIVKLFLKRALELDIDLNSPNDDGEQPFMTCLTFCHNTSLESIKLLLEDERIDVNATDNQGLTVLLALYGHRRSFNEKTLQIIDLLQSSPRINDNVVDRAGRNPLHLACENDCQDNFRRVELYLKMALEREDIDVNQRDEDGKTPAHFAFSCGSSCYFHPPFTLKKFSETIEVFLKYCQDLDIDLNAVDNEGKTPLHYLCEARRKKSIVTQFLEAAKNEYNVEFDVNAVDHIGRIPIQYAYLN